MFTNRGWYLTTNQFLGVGDYLAAREGNFFAIMQGDGNLVVYRGQGPSKNHGFIWGSVQVGSYPPSAGSYFAVMQGDGNLCVYRGTDPDHNNGFIWGSVQDLNYTPANGPYFLVMQGDGNLCVYRGTDPDHNNGFIWGSVQSANKHGPTIITGTGPYSGAAGFDRDMESTAYCGNDPESWVRASAFLNTATGALTIAMQLETDSATAGPKGKADVVLKDANGHVLGRAAAGEIGMGGKQPGDAVIRNFSNSVTVSGEIARSTTAIDVTPHCTGSINQLWGIDSEWIIQAIRFIAAATADGGDDDAA